MHSAPEPLGNISLFKEFTEHTDGVALLKSLYLCKPVVKKTFSNVAYSCVCLD